MTDNARIDGVQEVLAVKAIEKQMLDTHNALESWMTKSAGELEVAKTVANETKGAVDKLAEKAIELGDKLAELEQKQAQRFDEVPQAKSIGDQVVESDNFKALLQRKTGMARIELKTAIINSYSLGMAQPLVPGDRLDMVWHEPNRPLRIRDVIPAGRTSSDVVWFPKENVFTNSAAHQVGGSPTVQTDNTSLAESAITFTNDSEQVCTLGHFIPVSLQALGDSNFLSSYINNRLMYGLKLKEETELLTGAGTLGTISGINTNATAYAQAFSPHSYDQDIEYIRDARRQLEVANYQPSVIILHPANYAALELRRETNSGQFIVGDPRGAGLGSIWGLRVVVSNSQTSGTATLLDPQVFQIFDREDAAVEVSFEDSTNFQKLMATVRAYERLAFVSYSTLGAVKITGLTA